MVVCSRDSVYPRPDFLPDQKEFAIAPGAKGKTHNWEFTGFTRIRNTRMAALAQAQGPLRYDCRFATLIRLFHSSLTISQGL